MTPTRDPNHRPQLTLLGRGVATYEIKMFYQPTDESFPCLVSNPRFTLRVFWDDDAKTYRAKPIDIGEMNRSAKWLYEGVQTMNTLHSFLKGHQAASDAVSSPSEPAGGSVLSKIAEFSGTFVGAAGKMYFG